MCQAYHEFLLIVSVSGPRPSSGTQPSSHPAPLHQLLPMGQGVEYFKTENVSTASNYIIITVTVVYLALR